MNIFQTLVTSYEFVEKQYPKLKMVFVYVSSWLGTSFTIFFEETLPIVKWIVALLTIIITLMGIYDWIAKKVRKYKSRNKDG